MLGAPAQTHEYLALRESMLRDAVGSNTALSEKRRETRAETKRALKEALKEPAAVAFTNEFGQQEQPRPKPQVCLQTSPFIHSSYPLDMNYVHFMNSISQKNFKGMLANFEYLQAKEMSRSQRYRLGRPPMQEEAERQEGYVEERLVLGVTGLSGVV